MRQSLLNKLFKNEPMTNKIYLSLPLILLAVTTIAQQSVPVTEASPIESNGLRIGYNILQESEKEVGKKGNFNRYNIEFYVTNTTNEAKMILYKQGFNLFGSDVSANLVQFNCKNATGARLTTKGSTLLAKPCNVLAVVEDKDCSSNKTIQSKRSVQIGFWIRAGETISNKGIVIVPLNEKPDMSVTLVYNSNSLYGSAAAGPSYNSRTNNNRPSNNNQSLNFGESFLKLRVFSGNTYINNQTGPTTCSTIDNGWWSAQWQLLSVPNTSYFLIKSRWKNTFLNNESAAGFSTNNDQALNSMWIIEPDKNSNTYTLKNAADNSYLSVDRGNLQMNNSLNNMENARWLIER